MNSNTITTKRRGRQYLTGIAAVTLAGTGLLAAPPAIANKDTGNVGLAAQGQAFDIEVFVTARKVAMAQDRIDRPWLYR